MSSPAVFWEMWNSVEPLSSVCEVTFLAIRAVPYGSMGRA